MLALWLGAAQALERPLALRGVARPRIAISVSPNKQASLALQHALTAAAAVTILSQGVEPSLALGEFNMPGVMPAYAADGGAGEQVLWRLEPPSNSQPAGASSARN